MESPSGVLGIPRNAVMASSSLASGTVMPPQSNIKVYEHLRKSGQTQEERTAHDGVAFLALDFVHIA